MDEFRPLWLMTSLHAPKEPFVTSPSDVSNERLTRLTTSHFVERSTVGLGRIARKFLPQSRSTLDSGTITRSPCGLARVLFSPTSRSRNDGGKPCAGDALATRWRRGRGQAFAGVCHC
jgi:hypothetical protein